MPVRKDRVMRDLTEYAVQYAHKGLSVIPMIRKKPMIKFADKPPLTEEEIRKFWKTHPYANIAVKTDKFFVFDVDVHKDGANGVQTFKELNHPEWFKDTLVQKTAHGGYQYFFLKPDNYKMTQIINFLPGIDIKAHQNNYVMIAPSIVDGVPYQWLNKKSIIKAPQGLIDLIKEKSKPVYTGGVDENYVIDGKTKTSELFEQIIKGFGLTGGRNNALAEFCGGLLFRNVDPEIVLELAKIANENTETSLPPKEVVTTVNSMIKKEIRRREQLENNQT